MTSATLQSAAEFMTNRRGFLMGGASLAVVPWLGSIATGFTHKRTAFSDDPFTSGIASGDPSSTGVVLWTRLAPKPLEPLGGLNPETFEVTWEVAEDDSMKKVVKKGSALATPQLGHSVHVDLDGLEPDRWYWYRFRAGDAESPIGRTRTMPRRFAEPEQLRFAFASCQHFEHGYFTAYDHMHEENLDMVLFLGDYIYEYAGKESLVRKHAGREIESLDEYRSRYAQYRGDDHLRRAHAAFPWLVVWDDHEFDNNCAGGISEELDVDPVKYLERRANAYQVYYESMPLRRTSLPRGPHMKLYRKIHFGRLAEFFMLDTRQYRTDQPNRDRKGPLVGDVFNPKATLLGDRQEQWLMNGLIRSQSDWNILGQQIMMGRVDRYPGKEEGYSMDQWSGYDVPRRRLLRFFDERRIPNPVVLTGDIHTNWANDLKVDFDNVGDPTVATEFVATSITSGGNGKQRHPDHDQLLAENPFVKFHNAERGYVTCSVNKDRWHADFQVIDEVEKPGGKVTTRASFVVESGKPGVQDA